MTSILNCQFKPSVRLQEDATADTPDAAGVVEASIPALFKDGEATDAGTSICEQAKIINESGDGKEECKNVLGETEGLCVSEGKPDPECHLGIMMMYPHLEKIQEKYSVDRSNGLKALKACMQCMAAGADGHETCENKPFENTTCSAILETIFTSEEMEEEMEAIEEEEEAKTQE